MAETTLLARVRRLLSTRSVRVRTPTLLQMEAVECGAAALGIILGYHGRNCSLEQLRLDCGVSRDGTKASNILKAARRYGLKCKGLRKEPDALPRLPLPMIVFWNFNHFLVVEGFGRGKVFLNDPDTGPRTVAEAEFDESFTGVVLVFVPGPDFEKGGKKPSLAGGLGQRLAGSRQAVAFAVLTGLLLVVPGLLVPGFLQVFVDDVLVDGMSGWITPLLVAMAATAMLAAALTWLQQHYLLRLRVKLTAAGASRFLLHVLRLPMTFFSQRYAGEVGHRVRLNERVAALLSEELAGLLLNVMVVSFFALVMLHYDAVLTLVGLTAAATNVAVLRYLSRKRSDSNLRLTQEHGKMMAAGTNGLRSIESLKAGGTESDFFARWAGYHAKTTNAYQQLALYGTVLGVVPGMLTALSGAAILTVGGLRVMDGHLTLGMLVAFQALMTSFVTPFNMLVLQGASFQDVRAGMSRLDDVLRHPLDRQVIRERSGHPVEAQRQGKSGAWVREEMPLRLPGHLEVRGLTFGYSRLDPPLIEGFDLTVKPGRRLALVGGSGSGKSTVARLVLGLLEPWEGEIRIGGEPRQEIPRRVITNTLAAVDQDIFLFAGTVRENLTLWDSTVPEQAVRRAAEDAAVHEVIAARRGGYDSRVEEEGRNFSGGQAQRLEIARALVGDPAILVLDEATSALDADTEKTIDENLRRRGCTCLIVAHRLSTIRDCDEIIVLDAGKIVQRGTHDELKGDSDGLYAQLIEE